MTACKRTHAFPALLNVCILSTQHDDFSIHVYIRQLYGLQLKFTLIQLQNENIDILRCIVTSQIYFAFLFNKRYNVKEFHRIKQLASENTMNDDIGLKICMTE